MRIPHTSRASSMELLKTMALILLKLYTSHHDILTMYVQYTTIKHLTMFKYSSGVIVVVVSYTTSAYHVHKSPHHQTVVTNLFIQSGRTGTRREISRNLLVKQGNNGWTTPIPPKVDLALHRAEIPQ